MHRMLLGPTHRQVTSSSISNIFAINTTNETKHKLTIISGDSYVHTRNFPVINRVPSYNIVPHDERVMQVVVVVSAVHTLVVNKWSVFQFLCRLVGPTGADISLAEHLL